MNFHRQQGVLLLESLIAIAVFAIGVLGNIALHAQAIRHLDDTWHRSDASDLAQAAIARMWAEDPATLANRYASAPAGSGYAELARCAQRLPGAGNSANAPEVTVETGPSAASRKVTVVLRWQAPGEPSAHRFAVTAVIGRNS